MNYIRRVQESQKSDIFFVQGFDFTGQNKWLYVKVQKTKIPLFEQAMARMEITDLKDFGEVVQFGFGNEPEGLKLAYPPQCKENLTLLSYTESLWLTKKNFISKA